MAHTQQSPIHAGFGPQTTAAEVLAGRDLAGTVAIVTGGYSGIGLETTRALARAGATVIVPARTPEKARAAVEGMRAVELTELDLMDPASIDAFAARFLAGGRPLHILVECAGVMATPLRRDRRGYESQFSTNHLGHFHLTARLWPALEAAHGARVVAISSRGHRLAGIDFADPNFERRAYDRWLAYGQSKTANALFALELDRRAANHGVRAFAVHPGLVPDTDLGRDLSGPVAPRPVTNSRGVVSDESRVVNKNPAQGAATGVWCATSHQLDGMGGVYCEDCDVAAAVPADSLEPTGVRPWAIDPELARRLWDLSEQLTGVAFDV